MGWGNSSPHMASLRWTLCGRAVRHGVKPTGGSSLCRQRLKAWWVTHRNGCFSAPRSKSWLQWQETDMDAGPGCKQHRETFWFSWADSTWQRWHLRSSSKHRTAAERERAARRQRTSPPWISLLWFTASDSFSSSFCSYLSVYQTLQRCPYFLILSPASPHGYSAS